jgi:hypothetical protein
MNQPIELRSLKDLSQYHENCSNARPTLDQEGNLYMAKRNRCYLYIFKKSCDVDAMESGRHVLYHVDAGTIHIGYPSAIRIKNRDNVFYEQHVVNEKLGWILDQDAGWSFDPHVKQDLGDSVVTGYSVYYELRPGATRFEDKRPLRISVSPILFEEVSVFDIGGIGYELNVITPEQAAEKYFGVSDFTKFFSNYAVASKQMSLTPRERRSLGIERILLTGMHPIKPPSSFREYVNAGKQLFSRKHQVNPVVIPSTTTSVLSGAAGGYMLTSGRPWGTLAGIATMSLPFLGKIHSSIRKQAALNQLQRENTVSLSDKERKELLAKGALASVLTRRLTHNPTQFGRNKLFEHVHSHVHQKPTSDRTRWTPKKNGGRKIRRTRKK